MDLPCFIKAIDDRDFNSSKRVVGKCDILLFEGWRVGVDNINFKPFNDTLDYLIYLSTDLEALMVSKKECAMNDIRKSGVDMYEQYGGFEAVFRDYYEPITYEQILPVRHRADTVVHKDRDHHISHLQIKGKRPQHYGCPTASLPVDIPAIVVGAGQAGLCASFYLQQNGIDHKVLEKYRVAES